MITTRLYRAITLGAIFITIIYTYEPSGGKKYIAEKLT